MMANHASDPVTKPRPRTGSVVVPHQPVWFQRLGAWLVWVLSGLISSTLRFRVKDPHGYLENPKLGPVIFCVWHNRLALCMKIYRRYGCLGRKATGLAALVSASKDGALLAAILQRFGVQPVRGSSSRRGAQALLELTTWAERGYDLAITPDGPRGPRYVIQPGLMALAQVTGLPVVPASYHLNRKFCLKSWDRFQIPLPFASCEVTIGRAITVPRELSDEQRAGLREQLQAELQSITQDD